MGLNKGDLV
jgi:hypothetical protein